MGKGMPYSHDPHTASGAALALALGITAGIHAVKGAEPGSVPRDLEGVAVVVCDAVTDEVLLLDDADGSGLLEEEEVRVVYGDAAAGPDLSIPCHLERTGAGLLLLDGGTLDALLVLADADGDGAFFGSDEATFFFQRGDGPALRTPKAFAQEAGGGILVADDSKVTPRIVALRDLDGDGRASGEDEARVFYDPDRTADAPALRTIQAIAIGPGGAIYVGDAAEGGVFLLADENDDGDAEDEGEVRPFFLGHGEPPLAAIGGVLAADGGLYATDPASGAIWFAEDLDGDGDALDPEEGQLFASGPPLERPMDLISIGTRSILVADPRAHTLIVAADLDGDGVAFGAGEIRSWLGPGAYLAEPTGLVGVPARREILFLRGDIEGDGKIQLNDPIQILGILFAGDPAPACVDRLDANDDGAIDLGDPIYLLTFLFASGSPPPPPYPQPGTDPTEDDLPCAP